jgi:antitoxin component YwqK of YwqJK toxin-antitoxin module
LIRVIPFSNGVENGLAREYDTNGKLITVTQYKNGYFQKEEKINRLDKFGLRQGLYRDYYEIDQVKSDGTYKDDKKDGIFKEYAMDGRVIKKEEYRMGELLASRTEDREKFEIKRKYYQTGATKIVGTYKKGVPEGVFRQYDEKGNIDSAMVFSKGRLLRQGRMDNQGREQGTWKEFYESGHLRGIGNYVDGKKEGEWKFSFENDSLEQVGEYVRGVPNGPWRWYYPDGKLRREETYREGKEEGEMKEYDEEGGVMAEGKYVDGLQSGPWKFRIGEYVAEGNFIDGKEDGDWKQYYLDGGLAFEGEYIEGQETGVHKYYWPNGKPREVRNYRLGLRDGIWIYYDEGGAEIVRVSYASGTERKIDAENVPPGGE